MDRRSWFSTWLALVVGVLLCMMLPSKAQAAGAVTGTGGTGLQWTFKAAKGDDCCGFVGPWPDNTIYPSLSAACSAHVAPGFVISHVVPGGGTASPPTSVGQTVNAGYCYSQRNGGETTQVNALAIGATIPLTCPSNSINVAGTCQCNAGFVPNAGATACEGVCAATTGKPMGTGEVTALVSAMYVVPGSMCSAGCKYTQSGSGQGGWSTLQGAVTFWGRGIDWTGTGGSCTENPAIPGGGGPTDPPGTPMPPASAPPKGMCSGTVNGVAVVVPCGDVGTTSGGGAAPPPPGASGGAPKPSDPGAPGPGSFSPSTPTPAPPGAKPGDKGSAGTCEGDRCATTECVVVLKADMSMEKQCGTTYEDKGTFCKNSPGDPKCASEKSGFGGSCDAPVTCTGDAVQCQVAKQQLADSCDARKVSEADGAIYTGLKGTGIAVTGLDTSFNIGGMLPSGPSQSCALADTSFALGEGFSVSMPLGTLLCDKLGVIRGVIAAFGFVMWSIIVFGLRGN